MVEDPQGWQDWQLDVEYAVETLEEAVGPDGHPSWGAWHWDDGGLELHQHPEDLTGMVAPPWVVAVGMSSTGRAVPLDDDAGPVVPCRVTCVVARDGRVAARVRIGEELLADPPSEGRVLDTLRRCLGVATDPPPAPLQAPLVVLLWLHALATAQPGGGRLRWPAVAALHPAGAVAGTDVAALAGATVALDWDNLRLLAACGAATLPGILPEVAGWMDAGMLARAVLDAVADGGDSGVAGRALRAVDARSRARMEALLRLLPEPGGDAPAAAPDGGTATGAGDAAPAGSGAGDATPAGWSG